jgi:hypothetical protein
MEQSNLYFIARSLLQEKAIEFDKLLTGLRNSDPVSFLKNNKKILDRIVDVDAFLEEDPQEIDEILILLALAVDMQAVMIIDWSGEEYPSQVRKGIDHMLSRLDAGSFRWKNKNIEEQIIAKEPKRGEYLPMLFRALDTELEQAGFRLGLIDIEQDCYYYFVLPEQDFEQIINTEGINWKILDTNEYEIYLSTKETLASKALLYLKQKLNIPLSEIKTLSQQERILIETGDMSAMNRTKKEIAATGARYEISKKEA